MDDRDLSTGPPESRTEIRSGGLSRRPFAGAKALALAASILVVVLAAGYFCFVRAEIGALKASLRDRAKLLAAGAAAAAEDGFPAEGLSDVSAVPELLERTLTDFPARVPADSSHGSPAVFYAVRITQAGGAESAVIAACPGNPSWAGKPIQISSEMREAASSDVAQAQGPFRGYAGRKTELVAGYAPVSVPFAHASAADEAAPPEEAAPLDESAVPPVHGAGDVFLIGCDIEYGPLFRRYAYRRILPAGFVLFVVCAALVSILLLTGRAGALASHVRVLESALGAKKDDENAGIAASGEYFAGAMPRDPPGIDGAETAFCNVCASHAATDIVRFEEAEGGELVFFAAGIRTAENESGSVRRFASGFLPSLADCARRAYSDGAGPAGIVGALASSSAAGLPERFEVYALSGVLRPDKDGGAAAELAGACCPPAFVIRAGEDRKIEVVPFDAERISPGRREPGGRKVFLSPGDCLLAVSPGVLDAPNRTLQGDRYGAARLEGFLSRTPTGSAEALANSLRNELTAWLHPGRDFPADVCITVFRAT